MAPSERQEFALPIICPRCGQVGSITWEEDDGHTPGKKGLRKLVKLSDGFETQPGRTNSGDPVLICRQCKAVQSDD